jgi:AraC-like DNA-binding protein
LIRSIRSESFSPPLFAALCSPDLHIATERISRYKDLVAPIRLDVRETEHELKVVFAWPPSNNPAPSSLVLTELLFVVTFARMGTREHIRPIYVTTDRLPSDKKAFADFLGVPVQRGSSHCVAFKKSDAHRPFLTANEGLWSAFEPELRLRLSQNGAAISVEQRVRMALLEALPGGGVKMEAVAKRIGMSQRSLQRHLEIEGQNYKKLLQSIRLNLSQHYLQNTHLPTAEIAFLLGFEETNSFFRAFRSWTGTTPEQFRQTSLLTNFNVQTCSSTRVYK